MSVHRRRRRHGHRPTIAGTQGLARCTSEQTPEAKKDDQHHAGGSHQQEMAYQNHVLIRLLHRGSAELPESRGDRHSHAGHDGTNGQNTPNGQENGRQCVTAAVAALLLV